MSFHETWYFEKRAILICAEEMVSLDEVRASNARINAMLDEGVAPVHIIFDGTNLQLHIINVIELSQILTFLGHENIGWMVTVGMNPLITFMNTMLAKLFGIQMLTTQTLELAVESLERIDSTLPSVKSE